MKEEMIMSKLTEKPDKIHSKRNIIKNKQSSAVLISPYAHQAFGLRNVHGLLRKNGFESNLIFFKEILWSIEKPSEVEMDLLFNKIKELNPDLIALSVSSSLSDVAVNITKRLKPLNKLIIWGGPHPTLEPEKCIKHTDIICIGEGELPILELMNNLRDKKDISNIKSLWVKQGENISKNLMSNLNEDLDSISFYDLSDEYKYFINKNKISSYDPKLRYSQYELMASRGCQFACSFCINSYLHRAYKGKGKFLRNRSVENVIKELVDAKNKLKIKEVFFYDEIFVLDEDWLDEFLDEYKEKINLPFSLCLHPSIVKERIIKKFKSAGLDRVGIGIQSGSKRLRYEILDRFVTDEKILEIAKIFKKYKIMATWDIILDNPYETEADMEESMNLLLKMERPYSLNVFSLINFPKTTLTERMIRDNKMQTTPENDFNWKMDIDKKRNEKRQIYNLKISLLSKSFVPKSLIKNTNDITVLFMMVKASNFIKLSFMASEKILTGKINLELLKYYLRSYKKFKNFQR